jgi:hypothetical protein
MKLTYEEKLEIVKGLNWDYDVSPEDLLAVVEGRLDHAGPFDRERLFVRSLERVPWHRIVGLWGKELAQSLLRPDIIKRVWMTSRRDKLERLAKILRREPVSFPGWSAELREKLQNTVFSHRWYRSKPRIF